MTKETNTQNIESKGNKTKPEKPEVIKPEEEIPITGKVEDTKETVKVNFMDKNFIKDYVSKKTVKSDEPTPGSEDNVPKDDIEALREKIKREENSSEQQFTKEDFDEIAGFLIDLFDAGISTALRVWAKDTSSRHYELEKSKKDKLAKQGALILVKYKLKWSIEFVFVLSLLIFYAGPIQKARKRRSLIESAQSGSASNETIIEMDNKSKNESDTSTKSTKTPKRPPKRKHSEPK